mgnify:CR=1 FL=1
MPKPKKYLCSRCGAGFKTLRQLKLHAGKHVEMRKEVELLMRGHIPPENKLGLKFKGKNKVIIS